jgi:hypothetical protein
VNASQYTSLPVQLREIVIATTPAHSPVTPARIACQRVKPPSMVDAMNLTPKNAIDPTITGQTSVILNT